jgi:hypothetical protein
MDVDEKQNGNIAVFAEEKVTGDRKIDFKASDTMKTAVSINEYTLPLRDIICGIPMKIPELTGSCITRIMSAFCFCVMSYGKKLLLW